MARVNHPTAGITQLLSNQAAGSFDRIIRVAYDEPRRMARQEKRRIFAGLPGVTRQTTEIVHDVFVELRQAAEGCREGDHFYGAAGLIVQHFLIDYVRRRQALKRGAGRRGVDLAAAEGAPARGMSDALPLEYVELMDNFAAIDPRACEVFALCDLAGMKQTDAADLLDISVKSIERDLAYARAWWRKELAGSRESRDPAG